MPNVFSSILLGRSHAWMDISALFLRSTLRPSSGSVHPTHYCLLHTVRSPQLGNSYSCWSGIINSACSALLGKMFLENFISSRDGWYRNNAGIKTPKKRLLYYQTMEEEKDKTTLYTSAGAKAAACTIRLLEQQLMLVHVHLLLWGKPVKHWKPKKCQNTNIWHLGDLLGVGLRILCPTIC